MDTLIVITGPTAVGKTALTIELARHFGIPVINADSRQIYRELRIGTASPTAEQQQLARHYFVGTKHIGDYYNASMYEQEVLQLLQSPDLASLPSSYRLLSGGSMMYIDAVCNGIDDIPTIRDDIRQEMKRRYQEEGLEALCEDLRRLDPEHYAIVDRQNYRRVIHALEICYQTGRTYTSFRTQQRKPRPFHIIKIGLNRDREELYDRINQRVDQMMDSGMLEEATALYTQRHLNALNTVGYKELFDYLDGRWSLAEAVERIKGNTRRYARKQLTWFKRDPLIRWFHPDQKEEILKYLSTI
ncbi:MAG: tRNA (adenosine(37)-N6)-dimethylallyltransferase MiaA [Prevotella sp.]|nr:tRNA (adenosine(37)-N6)-dimethylallyltransferase MiaA [Prevotella sp.]